MGLRLGTKSRRLFGLRGLLWGIFRGFEWVLRSWCAAQIEVKVPGTYGSVSTSRIAAIQLVSKSYKICLLEYFSVVEPDLQDRSVTVYGQTIDPQTMASRGVREGEHIGDPLFCLLSHGDSELSPTGSR